MSIKVELPELAQTLRRHPFVYLLTVGEQPRPHIAALTATMTGAGIAVSGAGRGSRTRIEQNPAVTLLAPPEEPGGYSLIVDGTAELVADAVHVTPERAVLHRPAPTQADSVEGQCAQDCVELPTRD